MPRPPLRLLVVTPEETKVDQEADMVVLRASTGCMGVMPGHEARTAVLNIGVVRILREGAEQRLAVYGGLAIIRGGALTILTGGADWPGDIDLAQAEIDREHAERRLRERQDDLEIQSDQARLRRALVQIEVSAYAVAEETQA